MIQHDERIIPYTYIMYRFYQECETEYGNENEIVKLKENIRKMSFHRMRWSNIICSSLHSNYNNYYSHGMLAENLSNMVSC